MAETRRDQSLEAARGVDEIRARLERIRVPLTEIGDTTNIAKFVEIEHALDDLRRSLLVDGARDSGDSGV
jgi:hypothetical protein